MPRKKKQYKVTGVAPVLGHQPDATFEAALDKSHEEFLLAAGAITEVKKGK